MKGYDGKDAIIEYTGHGSFFGFGRSSASAPAGMRRIGPTNADLNVTEENNVITVHGGPFGRTDLTVQVPVETSVTANAFAGGAITIENISGEMEASNMGGAVTITNASGSVVAHSMTGKITVSLNKVTPDKAMSFSTMNGDIEVTLPASTKARLKTQTFNGDIYTDTDFDVKMEPPSNAVVEDQVQVKGSDGKTKTKIVRRRRGDEHILCHHQRRRPRVSIHHLQRPHPDPQEVESGDVVYLPLGGVFSMQALRPGFWVILFAGAAGVSAADERSFATWTEYLGGAGFRAVLLAQTDQQVQREAARSRLDLPAGDGQLYVQSHRGRWRRCTCSAQNQFPSSRLDAATGQRTVGSSQHGRRGHRAA